MASARTANAWGIVPEKSSATTDSPVIIDTLVFMTLPLRGLDVPGLHLPISEVAATLFVGFCMTRRVSPAARHRPLWFPGLLWALYGVMLVSAGVNGHYDVKRLLHLLVWTMLAMVLSSGRAHVPSCAKGYALGIPLGIAVGLVAFGDFGYEGRFGGSVGDPNAQGMLIVGLGFACAGFIRRRWLRLGYLALCVAGIGLTLSRTSLLAMAVAFFWVAAASLIRPGVAVPVSVLFWKVFEVFAEGMKQAGVFKERAGSDELRKRIEVLEWIKVNASPLIGNAPGQAHISIGGNDQFFFHSSYLALRAEAGWLGMGAWLALLAVVFFTLMPLPQSPEHRWLAAGLVGVAIAALNLGEVILVLPTAGVLGFTMWLVTQHAQERADADNSRARVRARIAAGAAG